MLFMSTNAQHENLAKAIRACRSLEGWLTLISPAVSKLLDFKILVSITLLLNRAPAQPRHEGGGTATCPSKHTCAHGCVRRVACYIVIWLNLAVAYLAGCLFTDRFGRGLPRRVFLFTSVLIFAQSLKTNEKQVHLRHGVIRRCWCRVGYFVRNLTRLSVVRASLACAQLEMKQVLPLEQIVVQSNVHGDKDFRHSFRVAWVDGTFTLGCKDAAEANAWVSALQESCMAARARNGIPDPATDITGKVASAGDRTGPASTNVVPEPSTVSTQKRLGSLVSIVTQDDGEDEEERRMEAVERLGALAVVEERAAEDHKYSTPPGTV